MHIRTCDLSCRISFWQWWKTHGGEGGDLLPVCNWRTVSTQPSADLIPPLSTGTLSPAGHWMSRRRYSTVQNPYISPVILQHRVLVFVTSSTEKASFHSLSQSSQLSGLSSLSLSPALRALGYITLGEWICILLVA